MELDIGVGWWLYNIVNVLNTTEMYTLKWLSLGFPCCAVVGSPPAKAGDAGSSPGPGGSHMPQSGKAHASQLLRLRSGGREPLLLTPTCLEPMLHNKRSHRNEKPAHRKEGWPPLATTRESPCAATKIPRSQKLIN